MRISHLRCLPRVILSEGVRSCVRRAARERLGDSARRREFAEEEVDHGLGRRLPAEVHFEHRAHIIHPRHLDGSAVTQHDNHVRLRGGDGEDEPIHLSEHTARRHLLGGFSRRVVDYSPGRAWSGSLPWLRSSASVSNDGGSPAKMTATSHECASDTACHIRKVGPSPALA